MRLRTKGDKNTKALEKRANRVARFVMPKRLRKKTSIPIGDLGAASVGLEEAEEAARADDVKWWGKQKQSRHQKGDTNFARLADVPLRLPCRMSVRRTVKANEDRYAYILDGMPGEPDRYVTRISESQTPPYESIGGTLLGIINAGGPATRRECNVWFEDQIAEDMVQLYIS